LKSNDEKQLQERVMRQLISGIVAAVAVMAAAPAMACGYSSCSPCATGYVSPCGAPAYSAPIVNYGYTACGNGCGWVAERLPNPVHQYYYVNQGPTYTGPGNWAPVATYEDVAPYYGYRAHRYYRGGYYAHRHGYRALRRYY